MDRKRIDRIIDIKEKVKKDKEREIEEAASRMAAIGDEILVLDRQIEANYGKFCGPLSGNDFAVIRDYLEYLDVSKMSLVCEKASMQETLDILYQEFYEFARELKMLSKLQDKIARAFKKSENRREQKLLDELALRIESKKL